MPRSEFYTRAGILSQLDLRPYSATTLYDRGGSNVTMPTFDDVGEGLYDDAMQFLNGRASLSASTFQAQWNAIWTAATGATPNATVEIDEDDKLRFEADLSFSINALAANASYGVNTAGQTSSLIGGRYVLVADNDWVRGTIDAEMAFTVPSAAIIVPAQGYRVQDIPSLINGPASVDTLELLELNASYDVRWYIDDDGHAAWASPNNTTISWTNTDFRDLLGFDGSEVTSLVGASTYGATSTYPVAGVLVPSRPVVRQNPGIAEESSARRTMGNGWASNQRGTFQQHTVEFYIDGPFDCKDEMQHWLRRCLPRLGNGRKVTFYQDWGDSRLAAREFDDPTPYSDTYTSEDNGFRGRIEAWMVDNSGARYMDFPRRYRRRIPATLVIEETP